MTVEDVSWDLSPLVHGEGDAGADRLLDEAAQRAQAFADTYAGRLAELHRDRVRGRDATS